MAERSAEDERVRGYLVAQAAKLSIPDLVEKVRRDVAPLKAVADALPADHFHDRPAAEDWSAAEVLTHILEMNDRGAAAITGALDHGELPARIRDSISGNVRPEANASDTFWAAHVAPREALLARVLQATGDENLHLKITHPQFGELNWREWLLFMRVHDLDHMRQLQAITAHFAE